MNATLSKIIKSYSTDKHSKYISELHNLSKDRLIAIFTDLLTTYINDKNSSTLREYLTVSIAGYTHSINKIGYNGFKHNTVGKAISCEAKPRNFYSQDFKDYQRGKRKSIRKLNGGGNFLFIYVVNKSVKIAISLSLERLCNSEIYLECLSVL